MLAIAVISAFYNVVNPFVILGILAIVIAVIGIVAYRRNKK
jgi:LPXTG-motif cell wall-anchored protein